MNILYVLLAIAIVLCGLMVVRYKAQTLPIRGPKPQFFWGTFWNMYQSRDRIPDWLYEKTMDANGKTWTFSMPNSPPMVCVTTPENLKYILKDNFSNYEKGILFREVLQELLGDGIFNTDGKKWQEQRRLAVQQFKRKSLHEHMSAVMIAHSNIVLNHLENHADKQKSVDLQRVFYAFTLDSFSEIALGHNIDSINTKSDFSDAFDRAQYLINRRFTTPWWRIEKILGIGRERELYQSVQLLNEFVKQIVVNKRKLSPKDNTSNKDFLSCFIQELNNSTTQPEVEDEASDSYLIDIVMNFMIAGRDTTAGALTWVFYRFWKHPEEYSRVFNEIQQVIGDTPMAYDHIGMLPYTRAFLFETLRLNPSVSKNLKYAVQNDVLPDGTVISTGTGIVYSSYVMGKMKDIWGDDVNEFKPMRWIATQANGTQKFKDVDPYRYPQFNAGLRICLGKHMAIMETEIIICQLLRRFTFSLAMNEKDLEYTDTLTLSMKNGLFMNVKAI